MGLPESKENQIGTVTWREQAIPVSTGQVQIADMPPAMRESFAFWLSKIRYSPKLGRASSDAYFVDDIDDFIAWENNLAERLPKVCCCCVECGLRYGSRKPYVDGITLESDGAACEICGIHEGVTVGARHDFGNFTLK